MTGRFRGLARWANLPPEARIADRLADILVAVHDVRTILEDVPQLRDTLFHRIYIEGVLGCVEELTRKLIERMPSPVAEIERDPELAAILDAVADRLRSRDRLQGIARDVALAALEMFAAPYALVFYDEIRRLDQICGMSSNAKAPGA